MSKEKYLVGIAAPTCAGKTTLMSELGRRLGNQLEVVNFDNYDRFYPGSETLARERANPTIVNWEDPKLFNYQRFIADMKRLGNGMEIVALPYSRESEKEGADAKPIHSAPFTVVEGIFALHYPAARILFDLKYYIDIPEKEMVRRRLERSKGSKRPADWQAYITGPMLDGTRKFVV